jgi:3-oxoacyl-[acyl-carrier protein] reductase
MGRLDGQVAIVTAAAGTGIGREVARRFLEEGAEVVISDAHARRIEEAATEMSREAGREVVGLEVNVTNGAQVQRMVDVALEKHGKIDVLLNNAGINRLQPVWEMSDETWDLVIGVNLTGTFYCTRAVLPAMMGRGKGTIVNMSSSIGWMASNDGEAHYAAAKAGVMAFTRAVAAEVAPKGVRVNAIAPGLIYNEFLSRVYPPEFFDNWQRGTLLGRLGTPEDVANLVMFLVTDESSYITGEVFCISGGKYVRG